MYIYMFVCVEVGEIVCADLVRQELVEKNILMDSGAAPGLQGAQRELEKHMRADSLEKHIQSRPKPAELVEKGILNGEFRGT